MQFLPASIAFVVSNQDSAALTDLPSRLVAMLITIYHPWKTDVSFPSVHSTERDTNEGGK